MLTKEKKTSLLGKIMLLITTIIWGSSFVVLKDAITALPPMLVIGIRFTLSSFILFMVFIKRMMKITKKALIYGAVMGVVFGLAYYTQTVGLKYTTPAKNAFLTAWYCVLVPFLLWIFYKKKPSVYNITAAVLCLCGIGFVSLNDSFSIELGDVLTLVSGVFFAVQILLIGEFTSKKEDTIQLLTVELFVASLVCWIISLSTELPYYPTDGIPLKAVLSILYLSVFATCLAQFFQMKGQQLTSETTASLILSLEAVFGALFSILFYHEKLTPRLIIGFVIIFIALVVSETRLEFITRPIGRLLAKNKRRINGND